MQEIEKEISHQECFIPTLLSCFNRLANSVIFSAEFGVFVLQEEIVLLILKSKKQWKT